MLLKTTKFVFAVRKCDLLIKDCKREAKFNWVSVRWVALELHIQRVCYVYQLYQGVDEMQERLDEKNCFRHELIVLPIVTPKVHFRSGQHLVNIPCT